jgi:hypothetical protein
MLRKNSTTELHPQNVYSIDFFPSILYPPAPKVVCPLHLRTLGCFSPLQNTFLRITPSGNTTCYPHLLLSPTDSYVFLFAWFTTIIPMTPTCITELCFLNFLTQMTLFIHFQAYALENLHINRSYTAPSVKSCIFKPHVFGCTILILVLSLP